MKNIAIIPARSGSKGLKDKNIKLMNGKPLIYYSIKAAIDSKCFDEVFVSTDSEHYRKIATECGASVPFLRDFINAGDKSSSWDVVEESLIKYGEMGKKFDTFCLLQPTSPLRTAQDIRNAYDLLQNKIADAIVSIVEEDHSPLYASKIPDSLSLKEMCSSKYFNLQRQDLPKFYRFNGAIYIGKSEILLKKHTIYEDNIFGYIMNKKNSIDIDEELDFKIAEIIQKELNKDKKS